MTLLRGGRKSSFLFPVKEQPSPHGSGGFLLLIRTAQRKMMLASHGAGIWFH